MPHSHIATPSDSCLSCYRVSTPSWSRRLVWLECIDTHIKRSEVLQDSFSYVSDDELDDDIPDPADSNYTELSASMWNAGITHRTCMHT